MSVSSDVNVPYMFIVNTDKYTGNFERQLCAYATGGIGDCEVGKRQAEDFEEHMEELGFDGWHVSEFLAHPADDNGCRRPVSIWHDRDVDKEPYNSLAIYFEELPEADVMKIVRDRIYDYGREKGIGVLGMRMIKRTVSIVDEVVEV